LVDGRFTKVALVEKLESRDGNIFGRATSMDSASAVFKAFLEAAFTPHSPGQGWKDKIGAGFTNSAQSGDKLTTLFQLAVFAMQMGMIWVGVGDLQAITGLEECEATSTVLAHE
jgi:multimeric flavodoxin WrbA